MDMRSSTVWLWLIEFFGQFNNGSLAHRDLHAHHGYLLTCTHTHTHLCCRDRIVFHFVQRIHRTHHSIRFLSQTLDIFLASHLVDTLLLLAGRPADSFHGYIFFFFFFSGLPWISGSRNRKYTMKAKFYSKIMGKEKKYAFVLIWRRMCIGIPYS